MAKQQWSDEDRAHIAQVISTARLGDGYSIEEMASIAGMSPVTWGRAEDGERVRRDRLHSIITTLGWEWESLPALVEAHRRAMEATAAHHDALETGDVDRITVAAERRDATIGAYRQLVAQRRRVGDTRPAVSGNGEGAQHPQGAGRREEALSNGERTAMLEGLAAIQAAVEMMVRALVPDEPEET